MMTVAPPLVLLMVHAACTREPNRPADAARRYRRSVAPGGQGPVHGAGVAGGAVVGGVVAGGTAAAAAAACSASMRNASSSIALGTGPGGGGPVVAGVPGV